MVSQLLTRRDFNRLIPVIFACGFAPKLEANASPIRSCLKNPTIVDCISYLIADEILQKAILHNKSSRDIKNMFATVFIGFSSVYNKKLATLNAYVYYYTDNEVWNHHLNISFLNQDIGPLLLQHCILSQKYLRECNNIFYHQLNDHEREHLTTILKDYYAKAHLEQVFPEYPRGSQVAVT